MSNIQRSAAEPTVRDCIYNRSDLERIFLPVGQMLQIDRVCEIKDERLVCEMDLDGHWVFPMHFPKDPIFPGSLLIEAAGQATAIWAWHEKLRGRPRMVKVSATFETPVLPEDQVITIHASVRRRKCVCLGSVAFFVGERVVALIEPILIILPSS